MTRSDLRDILDEIPGVETLSDDELRDEIERLDQLKREIAGELAAAKSEQNSRKHGVRIGEMKTIGKDAYERVESVWDHRWPSFVKVDGKRPRVARRWTDYLAGKRDNPW